VEADDVVAGLHHRTPPGPFDVVLELHSQRSVVPRGPQASVDLAGGEDEPPALGQGCDGVHQVGHAGLLSRSLAAAAGVVEMIPGGPGGEQIRSRSTAWAAWPRDR